MSRWLLTNGPKGIRLEDIQVILQDSHKSIDWLQNRSDAIVKPFEGKKGILLAGPSESTLAAKSMIGRLALKSILRNCKS